MLDSTKTAIRAILNADPSISKDEQTFWTSVLNKKTPWADSAASSSLPRIVKRAEVMRLAKVSHAAVTKFARRGLLVRVVPEGNARGIGYTEESVRAFLEGHACSRTGGLRHA